MAMTARVTATGARVIIVVEMPRLARAPMLILQLADYRLNLLDGKMVYCVKRDHSLGAVVPLTNNKTGTVGLEPPKRGKKMSLVASNAYVGPV